MNEDSLYQMTSAELIDLLNQTRQDFLYYARDSYEAKEKKQEMDLILRAIVAKRASENPLR